MAKTKYFTEQVTGGSSGDASAEDMMRGYSDPGADEMPDDGILLSSFFATEGGGGFLGRAEGWER